MEITSTGRRKTAAASVRMVAGSGKITVNGVAFEKYFETEALRGYIMQPLKVCNSETAFDILGDFLSHPHIPLSRGISVKKGGRGFFNKALHNLVYLIRRGNARITKAKIENVILANNCLSLTGIFKYLPYNRWLSSK